MSPAAETAGGKWQIVYAIVKSGGRQHKVAVGDVVEVDRIVGKPGTEVDFRALLVVDGDQVTSDPWVLEGVKVSGEIVDTQGQQWVIDAAKQQRDCPREWFG